VTHPTTPAPLRPRDGNLFVVRWIRADGTETRHRYFRRLHDAYLWHERLVEQGREAGIFSSATIWSEVPFQ